ncbi:MAG TPA: Gfo/Idh/MocA family oxidoreductase [Gemmatimonadota bacterium]|nr:Gfo/Idh/MocA family oxidoreductase [Gemmatimonadota bacterium]
MADRPVRIGLLGAGAVAQTAHLPAFRRLRKAELFAICDVEQGKLRALRERTGVAHATTSIDELLSIDELDAIDICLPSHQHAAAAVRCLEAGKHVLCEKPLGLTAKEVEDVLAARDRSGKHVLVGMNNRYRDDSILLRRFIQDGQLGEVFRARAGWLKRRTKVKPGAWQYAPAKSGGGVVMDLGIQLLDLVLWLCAYPSPERVSASFYYHTPEIEVEDSAMIVLTCAGGLAITVDVSWHFLVEETEYDHFVDLFGTAGSGLLNPLRIFQRSYGTLVNVTPQVQRRIGNIYMESYERELAFFAAVVSGKEKPPPLTEQRTLARTLDAVRLSAREGREVPVGEADAPAPGA